MITLQRKHILPITDVCCLAVSFLLLLVSFAAGEWWSNSYKTYNITFTLWSLYSSYDHGKEFIFPLTGDRLDSVVLTVRACVGLDFIIYAVLTMTYIGSFVQKRRSERDNIFLKARTVSFLILVLFLLIPIVHAYDCPPRYLVSTDAMTSSLSWGWHLCLTSFVLMLFPCGRHCVSQYLLWRSGKV